MEQKKKNSFKDALLYIKQPFESGKGELAPIKFNSLEVLSDEEKAKEEQKKLESKRLKKAMELMSKGK